MTRRPLPLLLVALLLLSSLAPLASAGEAWEKQTGSAITAVATDERGDRIFVGTESGMVYCYDTRGGAVWSQTFGTTPIESISSAEDYLLVTDGATGRVLAASTGAAIYTNTTLGRPLDGARRPLDGARDGHLVYVMGDATYLYSLDPSYTQVCWLRPHTAASHGAIDGNGEWIVTVPTASPSNIVLHTIRDDYADWYSEFIGMYRGWYFRAAHTITGSTDGALTDYPIEITVIRGSGTSTGSTIYAPECRADFLDIRFTSSDGTTPLPFYRKSVVGNTATFVVSVPSIPASPETETIYVYWGIAVTPPDLSDPTAAYLLYDDFEDGVIDSDLWDTYTSGSGTVQEAGGAITLDAPPTRPGSMARLTGKTQYTDPVNVKINITLPSTYLTSDLNRMPFFNMGETFSTMYTGGDGTIDLVAPVGAPPPKLADNIAREYQTLDLWYSPGEDYWLKYGSDWNGTVSYSASPLVVRMIAGQGVNDVRGRVQINEIAVTRWTPNPPTHGAWSATESIATLLDTKTLDGTIIDIDAPETGDWVAVSTTTKTYIIEITDSGFGTVYSADRTGTPYDVAIANNGANTIEGRGILADIFRFDGVQTGTYTAGGPVRTVAIAQKNGLYAAAGSDDGKYYIFSKDESSSWYLLHASDSASPVTAIAMSWRGEIAVIGRADGSVVLYTTTDAPPPDSQMTVYIIKDGKPYIGKPVSVSTADISDPDEWTPLYSILRTDSDGKIVISTHTGHYYQININNGEKIVVIQASSATPIHSVVFRSPLIYEKYNYDVQYNASSQAIEMTYTDNEGPATVSWSIVRTDTYSKVFSHTTSGVTTATATYPISEPDISYKVNVKVQRSSGSIQNTWFITPQNASPIALPFWDENIQNAVFIVFLMILGGIFYYSTGAKGALIVALLAALFRYFSWITVPWFWIIAAVVFAFLANIAEGA